MARKGAGIIKDEAKYEVRRGAPSKKEVASGYTVRWSEKPPRARELKPIRLGKQRDEYRGVTLPKYKPPKRKRS